MEWIALGVSVMAMAVSYVGYRRSKRLAKASMENALIADKCAAEAEQHAEQSRQRLERLLTSRRQDD